MKIKVHNLFFLLTGVATLLSLSYIEEGGFMLWILIKSFYFIGVTLFIIKVVADNRKI